jgi:shikimate kinase
MRRDLFPGILLTAGVAGAKMKLVITGFMGSGKTRVARALAERLSLHMVDLDGLITESEGRSPAQLISEEGEAVFRPIETNVLRKLLESGTANVIALGGGAWIQETNRKLIDQYRYLSVWLDVPFEVCWKRIETSAEDRPLGKNSEQSEALYDQRRPIYELARIHITVKPHETLLELVSRIAGQIDASA